MGQSLGELVHWYDTSRCNLDCPGCFRERGLVETSLKQREDLARALVCHGVKQVNFGNGEPLLVSGLEKVLKVLHDSGVKTEIHTNGILLDKRRIEELAPFTDIIALPIDSLNPETQQRIRGKRFMPVLGRFQDLVGMIHDAGMCVGYHTVFTAINSNDVLPLWRYLNKRDFEYWRVYEFNGDLSMPRLENSGNGIRRYRTIQRFGYQGTIKRLQTDCLFAKFILKEEEMSKFGDDRVQFVGVHDPQKNHIFSWMEKEMQEHTPGLE